MKQAENGDIVALEQQLNHPMEKALRSQTKILRWHLRRLAFPAIKRLFDVVVSFFMLAILLPFIIITALFQGSGRRIFERERKVGRWGEMFEAFRFSPDDAKLKRITDLLGLARFALAINLLRGDLALVGPRALTENEARQIPLALLRRLDVKPGLICLWWIKQRGNIGYDGELAADMEYLEHQNFKTDTAILLKALPASVFGSSACEFADFAEILYIPVRNFTMNEAIEKILELMLGSQASQICFINADCANIAWTDSEYMKILQGSRFNFADGIGLKIAGRITEHQIKQNVNGTDLFPRLVKEMSESDLSVYFLGATAEVNESLRQKIGAAFPGLRIAGGHHGFFQPADEKAIIAEINRIQPDLLLVAFGAPRQEKWINRNLPHLNVKVAMGVGGLFDFYSGRIQRAPVWMREIGMEWFYRFLQEPQRMWKRYFVGNALFLYRVIRSNSGLKAPSLEGIDKE